MSRLKEQNVKTCVTLLREYINQTPSKSKRVAVLALNQLQKVMAGNGDPNGTCHSMPRADKSSG